MAQSSPTLKLRVVLKASQDPSSHSRPPPPPLQGRLWWTSSQPPPSFLQASSPAHSCSAIEVQFSYGLSQEAPQVLPAGLTAGPSPDHLALAALQLPELITEVLDEQVAVLVVSRVVVGHHSGRDAEAPQHWRLGSGEVKKSSQCSEALDKATLLRPPQAHLHPSERWAHRPCGEIMHQQLLPGNDACLAGHPTPTMFLCHDSEIQIKPSVAPIALETKAGVAPDHLLAHFTPATLTSSTLWHDSPGSKGQMVREVRPGVEQQGEERGAKWSR